jgi:copper(I)-binding protein
VIRRSPGKTVARRMLIAAVVLLVPALAGCEAGLNAPTLEFHPASSGAHDVVNDITISNAFVLGPASGSTLPAGASASFFVGLYNGGQGDDTLLSVSAPTAAKSATIDGGSVSLPVDTSANLTGPEPKVVLSGLTRPLAGGQAIPIILDFQHAGAVTLEVPVMPHSYEYASYSPPAIAPASASASASATP